VPAISKRTSVFALRQSQSQGGAWLRESRWPYCAGLYVPTRNCRHEPVLSGLKIPKRKLAVIAVIILLNFRRRIGAAGGFA
jgi:hypothetical protein